jgi:hypothetical protein
MKKRKIPRIVNILILTLLTVTVWVSFDVYRLITNPSPPSVPASVSEPLDPSLNQDTITKVESAIYLDSSQIPDSVVGSVNANPTPEASSEPTIEQ